MSTFGKMSMVLASLALAAALAPGAAFAAPEEVSISTESSASDVTWNRLWGTDALGTMSAIVEAGDWDAGGTVMIARNDDYYDALTASGYAGLADAPVLLTDSNELSSETRSLIASLKPRHIVICGGTAAVSSNVESQIKSAAPKSKVSRAWGNDAVGTANDIARKAVPATGIKFSRTAFLVTQSSYHDALAAAPVAYANGMPVFLADADGSLGAETASTMKKLGVKRVCIAGGTAALPASIETQLKSAGFAVQKRFAGKNACDTSQLVASYGLELGMSADRMGVATRDGYWDALCGAALCGHEDGVLVLVASDDHTAIDGFVREHASEIEGGYVFGGEAAVAPSVKAALDEAVGVS